MALPFTMSRRSQVPAEQSTGFGAIAERFRRAGELERAVALCQEGLQKFPDHLSARVTLGWAYLDLGKHDEARSELERVIRRAPDNLAAIRGLAALHDRMESADVEHMDAGPMSWPPPNFAVPPVAPHVAIAPEPTPEVHTEVHTDAYAEAPVEQKTGLEDLPLFQAAAQQEQEEAFHQQHAYEAPVEYESAERADPAEQQDPFLPFGASAAPYVQESSAVQASEPVVQAPSIDDFDPVFPAADAGAVQEQVAADFDQPISPMAFEMPVERTARALESEFALSMPPVVSPVIDDAVATEPVHVPEPIHVEESVDVAAPAQMSEPEPVQITEPVQFAEPVKAAVEEPVPVAQPVQMAEPVHVPQPVQAAAEVVPPPMAASTENEVPDLLDLDPLLLTVDDEPRPVGSVTIEPVIDEPLTLDEAMPLTLDVEAIAVEDASLPPADGSSTAHVVFPVRMQPAKPALAALERLLKRVEDRKLAAIKGSLAS